MIKAQKEDIFDDTVGEVFISLMKDEGVNADYLYSIILSLTSSEKWHIFF